MVVIQELTIPQNAIFPPEDLYSDEPPLESDLHRAQMTLLIECLELFYQNRDDIYVSGNITIYYSPRQIKSEDFRGPDFFVVLGTERKPRNSWVVWEEDGKYPDVIIELLSSSTAKVDKGLKKQIYQDLFRTSEYFWFDPKNLELAGFKLLEGKYRNLKPNADGRFWSGKLGLLLGVEQGKLRFFTEAGELIPTEHEVSNQERQRANQERQRANQERQRAEQERQNKERLAAKLRELGIDPDSV